MSAIMSLREIQNYLRTNRRKDGSVILGATMVDEILYGVDKAAHAEFLQGWRDNPDRMGS